MVLIVDFDSKEDKQRLFETLKGLKPTSYKVELKLHRGDRSNEQNRYYWGAVIKLLSDHAGFSPDEMHEYLRGRFLRYIKPLPNGEAAEIRQSTTDLDTREFELYLEQIRMFAAQDLDIIIPLPNELLEA